MKTKKKLFTFAPAAAAKKKLGNGSKGAPSKFIDDKMRGLLFIFAFIPWAHCSATYDSGR